MNRKLRTAVRPLLAVATLLGAAAAAHAQVSLSVGVNTPGVYGQINIGGMPPPELLLPQPVVAIPPRVVVGAPPPPPLYLHVPPGYERHWRVHCHVYHACRRPVYFVSDDWYRRVYVPHRAGPRPHDFRGPVRHDERHDERHDDRHDDHAHEHDHDDHDHH